MTSIADGSGNIQTTVESAPSTLSWFGEVMVMTASFHQQDILSKINERVRGCRDGGSATRR